MAGNVGTIELLAQQIGKALEPLHTRLAADNVVAFLADLGLGLPPQVLQPAFVSALNGGSTAAGALTNTLKQLAIHIENDNVEGILQEGAKLVQQIGAVISSFPQIGIQLGNLAATLPGMNPTEVTGFAQKLPANLLSHSLISLLEDVQPAWLGLTNLLGVATCRPDDGKAGDPTHPAFVERTLQLSNLGKALTDPAGVLQSKYQWGTSSFDGKLLIPALSTSLNFFGLNSRVDDIDEPTRISSGLFSVRTAAPGLAATLHYDLPAGLSVSLPLSDLWSVHAQVQGEFKAGLEALIVPPSKVSLNPPTGTLTGLLQVGILAKGPDKNHPIILLGSADGSRLQMDSFTFGAGLAVAWNAAAGAAEGEPAINMEIAGGKAVIDVSKADGFIAKILEGVSLETDFELGLCVLDQRGAALPRQQCARSPARAARHARADRGRDDLMR